MKKLIYLGIMLISLSATAATPPEISEKVLKAFKETFSDAVDVTWKELDNSCQANFKLSEIQVRAIYDNEGNLLETVRYYGEKKSSSKCTGQAEKKDIQEKKCLG